ncbi:MAG: SH3 domain-containing protein [Anaerolineae bacterium]
MKRHMWQLFALLLITFFASGIVLAQDLDADSLNLLLLDGAQEVMVNKLSMSDVFDKSSNWEVYTDDNQTLEVAKGVYHMYLKGDAFTWGLNGENDSDTVVHVKTIQRTENNNNSYGIICRADPENNGNGYYFEISGEGYYAITVVNGDDIHTLVDWTKSKAINSGQDENEIIAVCVKDYLALYVNEVLLAETTDSAFTEGQTGLTVSSFDKKSDVDIAFDNVSVWHANVNQNVSILPSTQKDAIKNYAGDANEILGELEQSGIIPSGSQLIFNENYAYFTGQGSWFTPLASRSPRKNIVAGAELTFTVGDTSKFELCTLTSRIKTDSQGDAVTYIHVGIGNDGLVYVFDRFSESQDTAIQGGKSILDLDSPHNLLFLLIDDKATVYVDGKLEISDFAIAERSGSYGIALLGQGPKAKCEGRNIWAYSVPATRPGVCIVTSGNAVNKRSGPGTDFSSPGKLPGGEEATVIGQARGSDGKTWWQIEDESWVREDVVTALGDCADLPITG